MSVNNVNNNLIDSASVVNTTQALFNALQKKSVNYSNQNLQGFTRKTLGVDLYSTRTDINVQREIAIANSGAALSGRMNLNSIKALNSYAAQMAYGANVQDYVAGKMTIEANVPETYNIPKNDEIQNEINVFETNKDKKDSNPFTFGDYLFDSNSSEEKQN